MDHPGLLVRRIRVAMDGRRIGVASDSVAGNDRTAVIISIVFSTGSYRQINEVC